MPTDPADPIRVALLATPDTTGSTLFGVYDLLAGACRDWEGLINGREVASPLAPRIVSRDGTPLGLANGVELRPHGRLDAGPPPDIVVVTDVLIRPDAVVDGRFDAEARWIRERHDAGATVAAACTGAMLFAHAGILDRRQATSHWAYCETLGRRYPSTRWLPDKPLVTTGVGHRIVMAGSGTSWHALALYLVARFVGAEAAMQLARLNLLDWNGTSPLAYAAFARTAQVDDPVIARCQEWVAEHYREESPVAAMTRIAGLAERTFQRRFALATGHAPLEYVHTLRLEEAKLLLEMTDRPIEAIAAEVGYQDAGFFARLFRRKVGVTPAHYRRRFGTLARHLAGARSAA